MATIHITIKNTSADANNFTKADQPHRCLQNAARLLQAYASGSANNGGVDIQLSANDPVRASGTLTVVYATIADTDTVVIGGTTLTCVTGTSDGLTQFKKVTNLATTIANLAATINANTTLNKLVSAAVTAVGVVTITALTPGVVGNQITLVGSAGATASAANFTAGAGGSESVKASFRG